MQAPLKPIKEPLKIKEYILSYNNICVSSGDPNVIASAQSAYNTFESKYLDPFKKMVQSEAKILRKLADKAISFYLDKDPKINSGEIFDQFQEADWSGKSTVFQDNEPHDFFYISEPTTTTEKIR